MAGLETTLGASTLRVSFADDWGLLIADTERPWCDFDIDAPGAIDSEPAMIA